MPLSLVLSPGDGDSNGDKVSRVEQRVPADERDEAALSTVGGAEEE